MNSKYKTIRTTIEVEAVDIPTMYEMSEDDYRYFVHNHGLVFVDHHDVLRSSPAEYPLATTLEQLDILIEELQSLRIKMVPKSK